jgi:hypothetical protein
MGAVFVAYAAVVVLAIYEIDRAVDTVRSRDKRAADAAAKYKADSDRFEAAKASAFRNCRDVEHGYPVMGFGPSVVCLAPTAVLRVEVMP